MSTDFECDWDTFKLLNASLKRITLHCLDHDWYDAVNEIIKAVIPAYGHTPGFTQNYTYAVSDLGFNLNYIGEEGAGTKRSSSRAPQSLHDSQDLYLSRLTHLRRSAIEENKARSVTQYCQLLEQLADDALVDHIS